MRKVIIPLAMLIAILCSSVVFAQKPLDPDKDFNIGLFKCGETLDQNLAEKHFGKITETSDFDVKIENGQYYIIYSKEKQNEEGTIKGHTIKFQDVTFKTIDNKIASIKTTGKKAKTERGLMVGDDIKKMMKLYGVSKEDLKEIPNSHIFPGEETRYSINLLGNKDGIYQWLKIDLNGRYKVVSIEVGSMLKPGQP